MPSEGGFADNNAIVRRLIALAVVLTLGLGADVAARSFVEGKVDERAREEAPAGSRVDASVGSFPFLPSLLLTGTVSKASVHLENIAAGVLVFAQVDLELRGVRIDRSYLIQEGKARIHRIDKGVVSAEITAEAIEKILRVPVRMAQGTITLTVAGREIPVTPKVSATGQLTLEGNGLSRVFSLKIPKTDYVPCVGQVTILAGRMRLSCEIDEVPPALIDAAQEAAS